MASHPTIIHSRHHHGSEVPTVWVLGYIAIALVSWLIAAILLIRHEQATSGRPVDTDDKVMGVIGGAIAAIAWPLTIVGYGTWRIVDRFTRSRIDLDKGER